MDSLVLSKIKERAELAIAARTFPGCCIGVLQAGERHILPFGKLSYEWPSVVRNNSIYDIASITKSIPVASLALHYIAKGRLALGINVKTYLPGLQNHYGATIEDLLRYRVKGPQMSKLPHTTFEEIRTAVFERGFDGPPGASEYTNLPAYLLGIILEKVGGRILPALANDTFFGPLQMHDTSFFVHDAKRVAPTEVLGIGRVKRVIRGIVHDESARVFAEARRAVGHAGLFSTAPDLLTFLEALLSGKFPAVLEGAEQGLGWALDEPWRHGRYDAKLFSKTGFTGTLVALDRRKDTALVILSNRTYPERPRDNSAINSFRQDITDIVFG